MSTLPEIGQRDLRLRSKEIMDSIEAGQAYTVTRGGHRIAELVPIRRTRRFVTRADFVAASHRAPTVDLARFRADQESALDQDVADPFAR